MAQQEASSPSAARQVSQAAAKIKANIEKVLVGKGGIIELTLAAVLSGAVDCGDRVIAVVLSGANIDAAVFREVLKDAEGR